MMFWDEHKPKIWTMARMGSQLELRIVDFEPEIWDDPK